MNRIIYLIDGEHFSMNWEDGLWKLSLCDESLDDDEFCVDADIFTEMIIWAHVVLKWYSFSFTYVKKPMTSSTCDSHVDDAIEINRGSDMMMMMMMKAANDFYFFIFLFLFFWKKGGIFSSILIHNLVVCEQQDTSNEAFHLCQTHVRFVCQNLTCNDSSEARCRRCASPVSLIWQPVMLSNFKKKVTFR